jgi:energy-coupling factor transporter transmembrane protein EcfT
MNWGRLFFGALIVAFGALWLLDAGDVLDAGTIISEWWPVVIIAAGLVALMANPRQWVIAALIVLVGVAFLLATLDIADIGAIVVPIVIIVIGLLVIFGRGMGAATETGDTVRSFNVFSGSNVASHSDSFQGGSVSAVFGGGELDLRDANPAPDAQLDVFTAFGGFEIKVPQGWQVDIKGLPIFGGFDNVTAKEQLGPEAPRLTVNATVLFGGLDIKH